MSIAGIRIRQAEEIINRYRGEQPLSEFLKTYFRENKKFGSRDRREIQALCFAFFRIPTAQSFSIHNRLILAAFVSNIKPISIDVEQLNKIGIAVLAEGLSFDQRMELASKAGKISAPTQFVPFHSFLSNAIDLDDYAQSFYQQPFVFGRIQAYYDDVISELEKNGLEFEKIGQQTLKFKPDSKLDGLQSVTSGYFVIQDLSSQQTLNINGHFNKGLWWDCCCGGGGKSLLLLEKNKDIKILATDKRSSIIENYKKRLNLLNRGRFNTQTIDLVNNDLETIPLFDGIIADVPCSGSGTFSRNPEQLNFFNSDLIGELAQLQKKIVAKTLAKLKSNGIYIYITCSVFSQENEEVVKAFAYQVSIKEMKYINGTRLNSDSLFVALMEKN